MVVVILIIVIVLGILIIRAMNKKSNNGSSTSLNSILEISYPKKSYREIFEIGVDNAVDILSDLPSCEVNLIEIYAFLNCLGSGTVQTVNGDLQKYHSQINEFLGSHLSASEQEIFLKRAKFYRGIYFGDKIEGICFQSDVPPSIQSVPMLRCTVAFGDCITNPDLIRDYYKGGLTIHGFSDTMAFQQRFTSDFFRFVHTYCVMIAGKEFDPPILKEYDT